MNTTMNANTSMDTDTNTPMNTTTTTTTTTTTIRNTLMATGTAAHKTPTPNPRVQKIQRLVNHAGFFVETQQYANAILYYSKCLEASYSCSTDSSSSITGRTDCEVFNAIDTQDSWPQLHQDRPGDDCATPPDCRGPLSPSIEAAHHQPSIDTANVANSAISAINNISEIATVYQQPMRFDLHADICAGPGRPPFYGVIMFNLALSYQLQGMYMHQAAERSRHLQKACRLYSLTLDVHAVECDEHSTSCDFLVLVTLNNLALTHQSLGQLSQADGCYDDMISLSLCYLLQGTPHQIPYFDDFFRNAWIGKAWSKTPAPAA